MVYDDPPFLEASVAQLVEHHVANVNVEGSNPFARSIFTSATNGANPRQSPPFTGVFHFSYLRLLRQFAICFVPLGLKSVRVFVYPQDAEGS
jgi:hypothetical protein